IYLLKGELIYPDHADRGTVISCGEANCFFVPTGYHQEILADNEGKCEFLIVVTGLSDFAQSAAREEADLTISCRLNTSNLLFGLEQSAAIGQFINCEKP